QSLFLHQTPPDLHDQFGDIDLARTDLLAVAALDAEALDLLGFLQLVEPGGENGPDAAGVDLAENMSADEAENRTDIQAGAAPDALECLFEFGIARHLGPAVVHQDYVQLLGGAVGVGRRTGDDRNIAGKKLGRGAPRQGIQNRDHILELFHELFDADQGDVDLRQSGDHPGVPLVGDEDDAPGFGDRDIPAADPHVCSQELGAELFAGHFDQSRNVGTQALVNLLAEEIGDLLLGHVDGRHDHV